MTRIPLRIYVLFSMLCFVLCEQNVNSQEVIPQIEEPSELSAPMPDAVSLLGKPLFSPDADDKLVRKLDARKRVFEADPNDPDALIWYGRFVAYTGDYQGAIAVFNAGAKQFPKDARMLRHAGHRYISIRKFDQAIEVLKRAAELTKGKDNQIEPDGMPNPRNIPVSTLHGNIWYHLGLAYYLKHDFKNALQAYENCLATAGRPDNVVSATHWIYMINRRLGRNKAATRSLDSIRKDMDVIENSGYHNCCCFYKGLISLEELEAKLKDDQQPEAVQYAIGNWHFYNGDTGKARSGFEELIENGAWNSFGYIAAESELATATRK